MLVQKNHSWTRVFAIPCLAIALTLTGCLNDEEAPAPSSSASSINSHLKLDGPSDLTAGVCTPFLIKNLDALGALTGLPSNQNVSLQDNLSGKFYTDGTCAANSQVAQVTMASGQSMQPIYYKNETAPQSIALIVGNSALSYSNLFVNVVAPAGSSVAHLGIAFDGPGSITSNSCSIFTAMLVNANNGQTTTGSDTVVNLGDAANGTFFSNSACTQSTTSLTIPAGSSLKTFYYLNTTAPQTVVFTGTATSVTTGSKFVNITTAAAAGATLSLVLGGPSSIQASACSSFSVKTVNTSNIITAVTGATGISLADNGSGTFYTDSGCTNSTTSLGFGAGDSIKIFYYKTATAPQSITFLATATGIGGGTLPVNVTSPTSGTDSLSLVMSGPSTIQASSCTSFSVKTVNGLNNTTAVTSTTSITLADNGTGGFYSDAACTAAAGTVSFSGGDSIKIFYYKTATAPQSMTFLATATGLGGGTLPVTVTTASSGSTLSLVLGGPSSISASSCASFSVKSVNSSNNTTAVSASTPIALQDNGTGTFYSDASCTTSASTVTFASGDSIKIFYYKTATAPQNMTFLATATGLGGGTLPVAVTVADTSSNSLSINLSGPSSIQASSCASFSVKTVNSSNNTTAVGSTTAIALSDNGTGGFYSDAACTTSAATVSFASGDSIKIFYYKTATAPQSMTFLATATGLGGGTLPVTVTAADTSGANLALVLSGPSSIMASTCSSFSVKTVNSANAITAVSSAKTVSLADNGTGTFYSDAACAAAVTSVNFASGDSIKVFYYKNATAPQSMTFLSTATGLGGGTLSVAVTANTATPTKLSLAGPATINSGACSAAYIISTLNSAGQETPVSADASVSLSGAGAGSFYSDSSCTTAITSATVTSGFSTKSIYYKTNGTGSLTFTADGGAAMTAASLSVTVNGSGAVLPTQLALSGPSTSSSGACSAVFKVRTTDSSSTDRNVTSNTTVDLTTSGTGTFYSDPACGTSITSVTISNGSNSQNFYYKSTSVGSVNLTAQDAGASLSPASLPYSVTAGTPTKLALAGPTSLPVGTCSAYTISTKDASNNSSAPSSTVAVNLAGASPGQFYSDAGCTNSISSSSITSGSSSQIVYYKSTTGGTPSLTAVDSGGSLSSGLLAITIVANTPTKLVMTGNSSSAADACSTFTITSKDSSNFDSPVSSTTAITLSGVGAGSFYSNSGCTTSATTASIASGSSTTTVYFKDSTAESVILSAAASGLTTATLPFTVQPLAPTKLAIVGASSISAGSCSFFTLYTRDANNNATPVSSDTAIALSGNANGQYYSDSSCASPVNSATITSGSSSKVVYFKDSTAENVTLAAAASGYTGATLAIAVVTSAPTKLTMAITSPAVAGTCSSAAITSKNNSDIASPVGVNTTITLAGVGAGSFYSDTGCTTSATTATLSSGSSSTTVYYKNNSTQSVTLSAASAGLTTATAAMVVNAGPAAVLTLAGAASVNVNACTSYIVGVKDNLNNDSQVTSNTVVFLGGNGTGAWYDSSACSNSITNVTVATGNSISTVYYKNTAPESVTLAATSGAMTAASLPVTVSTPPPTKLVFSSVTTMTAGTCTSVTITAQNDSNINSPVSSNATIALSGAGAGGFYTSSSCSSGNVTSATMTSGTSSVTLYFTDSTAESVMLSASTGGLTTGTQSLVVNPGAPSKLAFVGPATVNLGVCSSYNVAVRDFYNNDASTATTRIVALTGNGAGTFYSDSACATPITSTQVSAGQSASALYFKTSTPASLTFGGSTSGLTAASANVTAQALPPSVLQLASNSSMNAADCLTLTVTTADPNGFASSVTSNTTVNFTGAGSGAYYSNSGCTTAASSVVVNNGTSTGTIYYKSTVAGSVSLASSSSGYTAATKAVTVNPGAAASMTLTGSATAGAGICSLYTLSALDSYSNAAPVGSTQSFSFSGGGSGGFYSDANCTNTILNVVFNATDATKYIYYKNNSTQSVTLMASSGGALGNATKAVTVNALSPSKLVISGLASLAAGTCQAYTVKSQDALGNDSNVVSSTTVTLGGAGPMGFFSDSGCTTAATTATIGAASNTATFYIKETLASSLLFTASAAGLNNGTLPVTVTPGAPASIALAGSASLSAGTCMAFTVALQDSYSNGTAPSSAKTVLLAGAGNGAYYSDSGCATATSSLIFNTTDTSKVVYFKDAVAESLTLGMSSTGLTSASLAVTVSPLSPSKIVWTGSSSFTAGSCVAYSIATKDNFNNASAVTTNTTIALTGGGSLGFFSNAACSASITSVTINSGSSTSSFYMKETVAGSLLFAANATGLTGTYPVTVQAGSPTKVTIAGSSPITAGVCSVYFVSLNDALNNPASPASAQGVVLSGNANGAYYSNSSCTSVIPNLLFSSGASSQVVYYKDNTAENVTLAVSGSGLTGSNVAVTVSPSSPTNLVITGASPVQVQACTAYTVTIKDPLGNASPATSSYTIGLASTGGGSFYSNSGCTTSASSVSIASSGTTATFYYKNSSAVTTGLLATTSGLTQGQLSVSVTPLPPSVIELTGLTDISASSCVGYSVTTKDSLGNISPVTSGTSVGLGGTTTGAAFYSDNACTIGVSGLTLNGGDSTKAVYFKSTVNGSFNLAATSSGYTPGAVTVNVTGAGGSSPSIAFNESSRSVSQSAGQVTLTVQLTQTAQTDISASYSVAGTATAGTDHNLTSGTVTIPAGQTSTTIQFIVYDTGVSGADKTVVVTLSSPSGANLGANAIDTITIQNIHQNYLNLSLSQATRLLDRIEGSVVTGNTTCVVRLGAVWCWGQNNYGQVGDGTGVNTYAPYPIPSLASGVTAIAGSGQTFCAIKSGALYCWGRNDNGNVGVGDTTTRYSPVAVPVLTSGVTDVQVSQTYACAIKSGAVYCWGYNGYGQLGDGTTSAHYTPMIAAGMTSGVTKLTQNNRSDNANHTCVIKSGAAYCWGYGGNGQIGDGASSTRTAPTAVNNMTSGVTTITAGSQATCAVKNGATYCWGSDSYGEVGQGTSGAGNYTNPSAIASLSSGVSTIVSNTSNQYYNGGSMCAIKSGALWCWGYDSGQGNSGDGSNGTKYAPVMVNGMNSGVTSVAMMGSPYTTCAIKSGAVYCWGYNGNYQVGDNTGTNRSVPVATAITTGATSIFASNNNNGQTVCAVVQGSLYCWGYGTNGQIGDGTVNSRATPTAVGKRDQVGPEFISHDDHQSSAYGHSCFIKSGALYCWGYNSNGEIGDGTTTHSWGPKLVPGMTSGVTFVQARWNMTCAIKSGALYCWGYNNYGQLGVGDTTARYSPTAVVGLTSGVTAVDIGGPYACAIKSGALYCWGRNDNYQVGDGSSTTRTTPVANTVLTSGVTNIYMEQWNQSSSCAIANGAAYCWGYNGYYVLGDGTSTARSTPTQLTGMNTGVTKMALAGYHGCLIKSGSAYCWGYDYYSQGGNGDGGSTHRASPVQVSGLTSGVTDIMTQVGPANHWYHNACAIKSGAMYCWGYNGYGQLGDGTTTARSAPVQVVGMSSGVTAMSGWYSNTCAIQSGTLSCWGYNGHYQVGDSTTTNRSAPYAITSLGTSVTEVYSSGWTTCAVANSALFCWGYENYGNSGSWQNTTYQPYPWMTMGYVANPMDSILRTPAYMPMGKVLAGDSHTCNLLNSKVFCWGDNTYGQLGDGTTTAHTQAAAAVGGYSDVIDLAVGANHACLLRSNNSLYCWGANSNGQLGLSDTTNRSSPTLVGTRSYAKVVAGGYHTCADSGGLWCWGNNTYGQLGLGTSTATYTSPQYTGFDAYDFALARRTTCASRWAGNYHPNQTFCWGDNTLGQLGDGTTQSRNAPTAISSNDDYVDLTVGDYHTCGIKLDGSMGCWGDNTYGQFGNNSFTSSTVPTNVSSINNLLEVVAGQNHTCGLTKSGQMSCWGQATNGQLAIGSSGNQKTPQQIQGMSDIVTAAGGGKHTCFVRQSGDTLCAGYNVSGQLGNNTTTSTPVPVYVKNLTP